MTEDSRDAAAKAAHIRGSLPPGGLFAGHQWRISPEPFRLEPARARALESLGRVLLQFYRAVNLLYRHSAEGKQPAWIAELLDRGKPAGVIALQRDPAFKNDLPRVIRPDLLLTDDGVSLVELDGVPGGIGLTAWLNQAYAGLDGPPALAGAAGGMIEGFAGIFGDAARVRVIVSEEAATYRPEMEWLAARVPGAPCDVHDATFTGFQPGDAAYRFFELFDLAHVPNASRLFEMARQGQVRVTPPPKPIFEEKLLFALFWNRNLQPFWRRELGEGFLQRLRQIIPYAWVLDPAPLPPHAAFPEINLTDWQQLKTLSKRERELVLKISGFSDQAWGSRGVHLGSDLSIEAWSAAVDDALRSFPRSPFILQRFHKPKAVAARYFDFDSRRLVSMEGRVRLCPYYFVHGDGDAARAPLGGVLATICPADKKLIHGMRDAILAPCAV